MKKILFDPKKSPPEVSGGDNFLILLAGDVSGVEKLMCQVAAGLLEEILIQGLDDRTFMGFPEGKIPVFLIERPGAQGLQVDEIADRSGL